MQTSNTNEVVSQEILAEVIAPILTIALFHALVKGIGALRNLLKSDKHSPKLDNQIKKIETQANKLQSVNAKISKRGLSDPKKITVKNAFIVGDDPRTYIRNLDNEYGKFSRLFKTVQKPMNDLYVLNAKTDEDSDQLLDDKYLEIITLVNKHWSEKDLQASKDRKNTSVKHEITTLDLKTAEALLKLIMRLLQLKIALMNLPYSDRAKEASAWVWGVVDHLDSNIDAALSYVELSIK